MEKIKVVDFDSVEIENTGSQFYTEKDIGKLKVEALQ
ncbi:MAG: ThiF family adenylyltransferase [Methanobrevibacter sp.]|nr:ThiF family adenylyltransferase [Methanobrevibacter sp.]